MAKAALQDINSGLLRNLAVNGELLSNIHASFIAMLQTQDFETHTFMEGKGMAGVQGLSGKVCQQSRQISGWIADWIC